VKGKTAFYISVVSYIHCLTFCLLHNSRRKPVLETKSEDDDTSSSWSPSASSSDSDSESEPDMAARDCTKPVRRNIMNTYENYLGKVAGTPKHEGNSIPKAKSKTSR
jgi:hypothetical protein